MNRLPVSAKGLLLPGVFVVSFILLGCFASTPTNGQASSGRTGESGNAASSDAPAGELAGLAEADGAGTAGDSVVTAAKSDVVTSTRAGAGQTRQADGEAKSGNVTKTVKSRPRATEVAFADSEKPTKKAPGAVVDRPPTPMLKGWTKPKVAIVLSGDQYGSLEPCGCTARQAGGFARRGDLFEQLRDKGWDVAAFDLGGTLKRSRQQDKIKFEKILDGLRIMKYSALGLAPAELRLGAQQLMAWHEPEGNGKDPGLAFLGANVVFFGDPSQGTPLPYRVVKVNGIKIGVTSVLGTFYRDQLLPQGENMSDAPISVTAASAALKSSVSKMKAEKPDLMLLLSYAKMDETKEFAKEVPDFDIILAAGGPEEPLDRSESLGKSMLIQVGTKGKHVAVLGYYPDAPQKLKFELVELDKFRFKNDPAMVQLMQDFQDELKDADLAVNEKQIPHPSGAGYSGAKKCGECHKKAFAKWSTTKHAHAYESLIKGRPDYEGKWVSRVNDMECLACHVTGWDPQDVFPFETGFQSPSMTSHLMGQQCENCHGPGSEHVKLEEVFKKTRRGANDPKLLKWRQKMHLDQTMAQSATGCFKCHDGDNSPKFVFAEYFKQIQHIGRD